MGRGCSMAAGAAHWSARWRNRTCTTREGCMPPRPDPSGASPATASSKSSGRCRQDDDAPRIRGRDAFWRWASGRSQLAMPPEGKAGVHPQGSMTAQARMIDSHGSRDHIRCADQERVLQRPARREPRPRYGSAESAGMGKRPMPEPSTRKHGRRAALTPACRRGTWRSGPPSARLAFCRPSPRVACLQT